MSWLGSGLSNLTGQISNFTKEVLTEGTEEVDDAATELKIAKNRILELHNICITQKAEADRLKHHTDELQEKLESSELQINAISNEYRSIVDQQKAEIQRLQQQHDLASQHGHAQPHSLQHSHDVDDHEHDFGVSLAKQQQISHLQSEVLRLESGNKRLQQALNSASARDVSSLRGDSEAGGLDQGESLANRVKELEKQLHNVVDKHQRELSELQDVHSHKLSMAKRKHKDEIRKYEEQIRDLQDLLDDDEDGDGGARRHLEEIQSLRDKIRHLEGINDKYSTDLEQIHAADKQKVRKIEELTSQLNKETQNSKELSKKLEQLQTKEKALLDEMDALNTDRESLKFKINDLSTELNVLKQEATSATDIGKSLATSTPIAPGKRPPPAARKSLHSDSDGEDFQEESGDSQIRELQDQIHEYSREIEQFELVRSDWQMEKEALEEILLKLRGQLREKEELLNIVQAQKSVDPVVEKQGRRICTFKKRDAVKQGLEKLASKKLGAESPSSVIAGEDDVFEDGSDIEVDIDDLYEKVEILTSASAHMENERDILLKEKEKLLEEISKQKSLVSELQQQSGSHDTNVAKLKTELQSKNTELLELSTQLEEQANKISQLQVDIHEKDASISQKSNDMRTIEQKLVLAENRIESLTAELGTQTGVLDNTQELFQEVEKLKSDLATKESDMLNVTQEKENLETSLEELDAQHEMALAQIIKTRDSILKSNEEMKAKIGILENKVAESEKSSENSGDADVKMSQFEEQNARLAGDLKSAQAKIEEYEEVEKKMEVEVEEQKEKCEKAAQALNDLHMQKRDLESKIKQQENQVSKLADDKIKLEQKCREMEAKLRECVEKDVSLESSVEDQNTRHDNEIHFYKEQNDKLVAENRNCVAEIQNLKTMQTDLEQNIEHKTTECNQLKELMEKLEQELKEKSTQIITDLETKIDSLQTQKTELAKELNRVEHAREEQLKKHEAYVKELGESREMDTNSLQAEHEKTMKLSLEKDRKILQLESDLEQLQDELSESKEMVQSTIDGQTQITDLLSEKEKEISTLQEENRKISEINEEREYLIKQQEAELSRLTDVEVNYKANLEETRKLKRDYESLKAKLKELESKEDEEKLESKTLEIMTDLEAEIENLNQSISEKDNEIWKYKGEMNTMKQSLQERDSNISTLNDSISKLNKKISDSETTMHTQSESLQTLQSTLTEKENEVKDVTAKFNQAQSIVHEQQQQNQTNGENENKKSHDHLNGDVQNGNKLVEELETLKQLLSKKDEEIVDLNNKNNLLTKLVDQGNTPSGNEEELKSLRMEKDRMMSILNDKSRECSTLKSEVHKLMNIISAEKSALTKLQEDNKMLLQKQKESSPEPNGEMTKEAVKKLSQIIRDKDMEIEALTQKTNTLLQVLQESSTEGAQISSLLQERDNLAQQVTVFQQDREQIIAALTAKHQESVAYHGEIQRLNTVLSTENEKKDKLQQEYSNIVKQYEDKSHALVKVQSELVNLKQKYSEVEGRYKEVLRQYSESQSSSSSQSESNKNASYSPPPPEKPHIITVTQGTQTLQTTTPVVKTLTTIPNDSTACADDQNVNIEPSVSADTVDVTDSSPAQISAETEAELEGLRAIIHSHEIAFVGKDKLILEKDNMIRDKEKAIIERDKIIAEKDKSHSQLSVRFHKTEEMLRAKDSAINSLKKQTENLTFQLQGHKTELSDLRQEREGLLEKTGTFQHEITMLKEANNKLSMSVNDKDFDINALKEKVNTLHKLVQDRSNGEKGEMDRLMKETETLHQQATAFKQDRDQFILALQQQQAENQELKIMLQKCSEKEQKLVCEVERLRSHLLQIEEGYTQDALEAEEREKDLRNRLAAAQERALSASSSVDTANENAAKQIENLNAQLIALTQQRDKVALDLQAQEEQTKQYSSSLANLQMVLEQFQREEQAQIESASEMYHREIERLVCENENLKTSEQRLQAQLDETTEALDAAARLSEQLDKKEEMISALREEVQIREGQLARLEEEVHKLSQTNEAKVEKALMKNLIIGYFHSPGAKKKEVLNLIAKVLDCSTDELQEITGQSGGWLGGLFRRVTPTPPSTPLKTNSMQSAFDKSFSELFIKYLETESTPQPQLKLPAEQMAREQQLRHPPRKTPAFNPFSAPVSDSTHLQLGAKTNNHPLTIGGESKREPHLLMSSVNQSLPLFTPASNIDKQQAPLLGSTNTPRTMNEGAIRPTIPSSSNILKDVLSQQ